MMPILIRLVEKLTGRPHRRQIAEQATRVTEELRRDVRVLSDKLRPYTEADDPLETLMLDVFNTRKLYNGNGYGHSDDDESKT